jgi:glycosyltransferase involved in cell wall biosynthesis
MPVTRLGRNHALAAWRLGRLLARVKPAIAWSAVGASNLKLLTAKILGLSSARTILSQHGHFEAESGLLGRLTYRLTPLTSRWSDRTIVVSEALRNDLIARWGASARKTVRIYNAIALPPESDVATAEALNGRPPRLLMVGRLVPEKGHLDAIRALAALPPEVSLDIAGEGPFRGALEQEAESLGLTSRIRFLGYRTDLGPHYKSARLLVLPSHTEAFGNVIVEAMGYGLPVVAARCGGPAEILRDGAFGALTPPGDTAALAEALRRALSQHADPARNRLRALDFAADKILDEYEALIATLGETS